MGWKDINMMRRRPLPVYAVTPAEPGLDPRRAALRKSAALAQAALDQQLAEAAPGDEVQSALRPFISGYLAGFARQSASKLGIDSTAESDGDLAEEFATLTPPGVADAMRVQNDAGAFPLQAAGHLVGGLEARCGSRKLVRRAIERLVETGPGAANRFLTDCDIAADPMQTRAPTMPLRFNAEERAIVLEAFAAAQKAFVDTNYGL
jgi:hypothetical protein